MKKVWYLENKDNDQAKTAKLFLYDKNGIVEAWLDLSSFAGVRNQPDWEIVFFSSDGKEIGRISYASGENEDDFWQAAVSGKGSILFIPQFIIEPDTIYIFRCISTQIITTLPIAPGNFIFIACLPIVG